MQVTNPKNGETVESAYDCTTDALVALASRVERGEFDSNREFPMSLIDAAVKATKPRAKWPLSPARTFWLHKLATEGANRPEPTATAEVDVRRIEEMFTVAAGHLKYPSVILVLSDGREVKMQLAGSRSKYRGSLMVASPKFGEAYYGRVTDGKFYPARDCNDELTALLIRFAADPEAVAAEAGHLRGACCFCNRKLEQDKSTDVGYGPTCAKNFGLVWGGKVRGTPRRRQPAQRVLELA